jgi:general secretion pathway protein C
MKINELISSIQVTQRTLLSLCVGLGVLLATTLGYCLWQWYDDWRFTQQPMSAATKIDNANAVASLINHIPDDHLFGKSVGQMPVTNLQMSVTGIVKVLHHHSHHASKAYISIDGQPSKIYKVGDVLPNGVKINDITTDAVILENEGRSEKLPLPREKLKFKPKNREQDI